MKTIKRVPKRASGSIRNSLGPSVHEVHGLPGGIKCLVMFNGDWQSQKDNLVGGIKNALNSIDLSGASAVLISGIHPNYIGMLTGDDGVIFSEFVFRIDNNAPLVSQREPSWRNMSNEETKRGGGELQSLRPRWAEEVRPKKQVKLRLEPDLIPKVEAAAKDAGLTRNDWIEKLIQNALEPK